MFINRSKLPVGAEILGCEPITLKVRSLSKIAARYPESFIGYNHPLFPRATPILSQEQFDNLTFSGVGGSGVVRKWSLALEHNPRHAALIPSGLVAAAIINHSFVRKESFLPKNS